MAVTIKYTGTQIRWPELSITGKQSVWNPGQIESREDAEAALLLATGVFTDEGDKPLMLSGGDGLTLGGQALTAGQAVQLRAALDAPAPTGVSATDTANLLSVFAQVEAAGGGVVNLASGTYIVQNLPLKTGIKWSGKGWESTTLKLADGANAAVFVTDGFDDLTGTSVANLADAPYGFAIEHMSIDGNAAQQTSAPAAINMYGHSYAVSSVHVRNCYGVGVRSEFGLSGSIALDVGLPSYEPKVEDVDIHHCGSWGWQHKGPTDALFSRVVIWKTGSTVDSGAFFLERGNGVNFNHCHTFGHGGWSLKANSAFFSANCQWEIGEKRAFNPESGGIWVRFDDCVIVGGAVYYINSSTERQGLGIRLGDQPNGIYAVRTWVDTAIYGCKGESAATAGIHFNGSSNAVVRALIGINNPSGAASATTPIHGTPDSTDSVSIKVSGSTASSGLYQNNGSASTAQGLKADGAVQKSALSIDSDSVETVPRWAASTETALATGTMRLTYFTPSASKTVVSVGTGVRGTAAAATPTLCRMGLYSVASNGDITLIASTANDTSLWSTTFSMFFRALTAGVTLVEGNRYAIGLLIVTGGTPPTILGAGANFSEITARVPRIAGAVTGLTDLPASVAAGSIANTAAIYYAACS